MVIIYQFISFEKNYIVLTNAGWGLITRNLGVIMRCAIHGALAQRIEYQTSNLSVLGSNPRCLANMKEETSKPEISSFILFRLLFFLLFFLFLFLFDDGLGVVYREHGVMDLLFCLFYGLLVEEYAGQCLIAHTVAWCGAR